MNYNLVFHERKHKMLYLLASKKNGEKVQKKEKNLYMFSADLEKAFNRVSQKVEKWTIRSE